MSTEKKLTVSTPRLIVCMAVTTIGTSNVRADFTFGSPTNLGPVVNSSSAEGAISVSADDLEMYFLSNRPGGLGYEDLWVSAREDANDPWGPPVNLGPPVNSSYRESYPSVSADGLTLYFSDYFYRPDRPGGVGGHDLWMATRTSRSDPWEEPTNLGAEINSPADEEAPSISHDGLTLIFSSERAGTRGFDDLWTCTRPTTQDPWGQPVNLGPVVNTDYYEVNGQLSSDGLTLFFESDRPGGIGAFDIWVTMRKSIDDPWGPPMNLGPPVNTVGEDGLGAVSVDGKTFYFAGDRPGGWGSWDMWQAAISPVVDFNGDGIVNMKDFSKLAQYWQQAERLVDIAPPIGNGIVDIQDVTVLGEYWLKEVLPASLIAYWKLDETEGFVAHDSVGDYDALVLTANPLWWPSDGKINGALEFDGVDDCVSTPFVVGAVDAPFSVFTWVKGGAPGQGILSQRGAPGVDWLATDSSDGSLITDYPGLLGRSLASQTLVTDGQWHRVGLVWDPPDRILYIDDVEVASDKHPLLGGSDAGLYIGAGSDLDPGTFWSGLIDDVKLYNQAIVP